MGKHRRGTFEGMCCSLVVAPGGFKNKGLALLVRKCVLDEMTGELLVKGAELMMEQRTNERQGARQLEEGSKAFGSPQREEYYMPQRRCRYLVVPT